MSRSLVAFDADRIKEYVFASGKLAEIRGASALLDRLNREEMPQLVCDGADPSEIEVFAHGGSGLFLVPTARADAIIAAVQARYATTATNASVTGVALDLPDGATFETDLRSERRRLNWELRAAKACNPAAAVVVTSPFIKPCDSCGLLAATEMQADPDNREVALCSSCNAKRNEDRRVKQAIETLIDQKRPPQPTRLWDRLIGDLRRSGYPLAGYDRPDTFADLGEQSQPNGYMGLIYADGDGMGRHLDAVSSLADMRRFATTIDAAIYQSVQEAIGAHLHPRAGAPFLPFDVLLLGGDDLVMVTTAQAAIATALAIVERFPELVQAGYGETVSLSAAVVIAHVNFPFRSLVQIAESALKAAKRKRARTGATTGLINFLVVSSANQLEFGGYYKEQLVSTTEHNEKVYRTIRPCTPDDLRRLIRARQRLGDAPRNKIEQLRATVFQPPTRAMFDATVTLLRWQETEQRAAVQDCVRDFAGGGKVDFPWFRHNDEYHTPLLDLAELYDFLDAA